MIIYIILVRSVGSSFQKPSVLPRTIKTETKKMTTDTDETNFATSMAKLHQFLYLGTESRSYDPERHDLSKENVTCILELIRQKRGKDAVNAIREYSAEGRAPKHQPVIFALAVCAKQQECTETRQAAFGALCDVCRTFPQLFQFLNYAKSFSQVHGKKTSGWGRSQRKAISKYYNSKEPMQLAYAVTKYIKRNGWSHKDVLRQAHVKPKNEGKISMTFSCHGTICCNVNGCTYPCHKFTNYKTLLALRLFLFCSWFKKFQEKKGESCKKKTNLEKHNYIN